MFTGLQSATQSNTAKQNSVKFRDNRQDTV